MTTTNKKVIRLGVLIVCANIFGWAALHHQLTQETPSILPSAEESTSIIETIQENVVAFVTE